MEGSTIRIGLLDLDICVYQVACASKRDNNFENVKRSVDLYIQEWLRVAGCTHYVGFITNSPTNFRIQTAVTWPYKGHRPSEKPRWHVEVRAYILDHWKAIEMQGMEADDGMAIAQKFFQSEGLESVIITEDKDLLQVPGLHYNPNKSKEVFEISEAEGHFLLWKQVITGDKTDNIPGVSQAIHDSGTGRYNQHIKDTVHDGMQRRKLLKTYPRAELYGEVAASNYLKEFEPEEYAAKVLELYIDKFEDDEYDIGRGDLRFKETFDLIYMLREHPDYTSFEYLTIPGDNEIEFEDF